MKFEHQAGGVAGAAAGQLARHVEHFGRLETRPQALQFLAGGLVTGLRNLLVDLLQQPLQFTDRLVHRRTV